MKNIFLIIVILLSLSFCEDQNNDKQIEKTVGLIEEKAEFKGRYEAQSNIIWYYKQLSTERLEDKKRAEMESYICKAIIILLICFGGGR